MKKLRIYAIIPPNSDCGVGYYRMWLPLKKLEEKGLIELVCHNFTFGKRGSESANPMPEPSLEKMLKTAKECDIMYSARNDVPQYISKLSALQEYIFDKHKKIIPVILDIDDNVHATRPHNPGYRSYYPNSQHKGLNTKSIEFANAITVSTNNLQQMCIQHKDKKYIFVCPNSLDFKMRDEIYKQPPKYKKKKDEIRIGWSGSAAHWENLNKINKPITDILKKYPNVTFYYTGLFGELFDDKDIAKQTKRIKWAGLKNWFKTNRDMNLDIAIAPLADNDFNRAKSNLRILEYSAAHYAVIASPVEPYNSFKKEVLYATEKDEWFKQIEKLILDKKLRKEYADKLYKRAKKDFNVDTNCKIWLDVFNKMK